MSLSSGLSTTPTFKPLSFKAFTQDIGNLFHSVFTAKSLSDAITQASHASAQLVNDLAGGSSVVKSITGAVDQAVSHGATTVGQLAQGASLNQVIGQAVVQGVDTVHQVVHNLIAPTSPLAKVDSVVGVLAHDAAQTAADILNAGGLEKAVTVGINHAVGAVTDIVHLADPSAKTAVITQTVNQVVKHITDSADAITTAVTDATTGSPVDGIHAATQVLDSVAGIVGDITDAVVKTNDPATLDQQAIAGVHAFTDVVGKIDALPLTIGQGAAALTDQITGLLHTTTPPGSVGDKVLTVTGTLAHDVALGLSDLLSAPDLTHLVTSAIQTGVTATTDAVNAIDQTPQTAAITHLVSDVTTQATHIANSIADTITGADVLGIANTAGSVAGSLLHIGQTVADTVQALGAGSAYIPDHAPVLLPVEPLPVI